MKGSERRLCNLAILNFKQTIRKTPQKVQKQSLMHREIYCVITIAFQISGWADCVSTQLHTQPSRLSWVGKVLAGRQCTTFSSSRTSVLCLGSVNGRHWLELRGNSHHLQEEAILCIWCFFWQQQQHLWQAIWALPALRRVVVVSTEPFKFKFLGPCSVSAERYHRNQ